MSHDQVFCDQMEAGKHHDSKVLLWKKSSTCQWFRLFTVCCHRFTCQPIIFLRCAEANAYFIGSGCAGCLSCFFSGCPPSFLRRSTLSHARGYLKIKERLLAVYMSTCDMIFLYTVLLEKPENCFCCRTVGCCKLNASDSSLCHSRPSS